MRRSLFLLCVLTLSSCYKSQNFSTIDRPYIEKTKELNLKDFKEIKISGASFAKIQKGEFKIIVTGDSTDLFFLKSIVSANRFSYTLSENNIRHFGLKFQISLPNLSLLDLSGASKAILGEFKIKTLVAMISGASELDAFDNSIDIADLNVSGGSIAKINVSDTLLANVSGASKIFYRGNPVIQKFLTGSSTIQKN